MSTRTRRSSTSPPTRRPAQSARFELLLSSSPLLLFLLFFHGDSPPGCQSGTERRCCESRYRTPFSSQLILLPSPSLPSPPPLSPPPSPPPSPHSLLLPLSPHPLLLPCFTPHSSRPVLQYQACLRRRVSPLTTPRSQHTRSPASMPTRRILTHRPQLAPPCAPPMTTSMPRAACLHAPAKTASGPCLHGPVTRMSARSRPALVRVHSDQWTRTNRHPAPHWTPRPDLCRAPRPRCRTWMCPRPGPQDAGPCVPTRSPRRRPRTMAWKTTSTSPGGFPSLFSHSH
jgi:hypothetical protein